MRAVAIMVAVGLCAAGVAGCGQHAAAAAPAAPLSAVPAAARRLPPPPPLSTAPGSCRAVVARTMGTIAARIEARAALHRRVAAIASPPALVAALTRPAPRVCARTAGQTVADAVGVVGERLVRAEATGPEVDHALGLVARDPAFVRAVRRRDAKALRTAIVGFFRQRQLHIVRVRATTPGGRLVNDVGGPFVLAPASRTIRDHGRTIGRVTLSVQDDTGFIKLMRRFTGAGAVLRLRGRVVPGSSTGPPSMRSRTTVATDGERFATTAFTTRAFPTGPLRVALLVPMTGTQPR
jgi:hypothetical protein